MYWKICSDIVFQILSRSPLLKQYLAFFTGKSAISQQISLDSFLFCRVKLCGYSSAGVIYCFLEHPPFPRRHCLSPAVTSGKFMKRIDSSICDDVTLFKGNDSSTYCQYFKLKVLNLTLNGFHLDFFLIDHVDKLHHLVIPQSQSSERMKSAFLQVCFTQLTLSSAKKLLLRTPPLHPKAQHGSRMRDQSSHGPHDTSCLLILQQVSLHLVAKHAIFRSSTSSVFNVKPAGLWRRWEILGQWKKIQMKKDF